MVAGDRQDVVPAGQLKTISGDFPVVVAFDAGDGKEPVKKELLDGTYRVGIDLASNRMDLFPGSAPLLADGLGPVPQRGRRPGPDPDTGREPQRCSARPARRAADPPPGRVARVGSDGQRGRRMNQWSRAAAGWASPTRPAGRACAGRTRRILSKTWRVPDGVGHEGEVGSASWCQGESPGRRRASGHGRDRRLVMLRANCFVNKGLLLATATGVAGSGLATPASACDRGGRVRLGPIRRRLLRRPRRLRPSAVCPTTGLSAAGLSAASVSATGLSAAGVSATGLPAAGPAGGGLPDSRPAPQPSPATPATVQTTSSQPPANRLPGSRSSGAGIILMAEKELGDSVSYTIDGNNYQMDPGQTQKLDGSKTWTIRFDRGGSFGQASTA